MKSTLRLAGLAGFLGVALGAFGAHWLPRLDQLGTRWIWEKAVLYQLVHAVVLLALALGQPVVRRWVPGVFVAGIVLFSGSLYVLALAKISWLGPITPLGGVCLLVGWAGLVCSSREK